MATEPLLTRSTAVYPNLVFIYDDSGSMNANYIYQYGGSPSGMGMSGPPQQGSVDEVGQSPNINRIYYDPRIRYKNRVDALGNDIRANTLSNGTNFEVYFYKSSSSATQTSTWNNTGNDPSNGSTSFFKSGSPSGYQPLPIELAPAPPPARPTPTRSAIRLRATPNGSPEPTAPRLLPYALGRKNCKIIQSGARITKPERISQERELV